MRARLSLYEQIPHPYFKIYEAPDCKVGEKRGTLLSALIPSIIVGVILGINRLRELSYCRILGTFEQIVSDIYSKPSIIEAEMGVYS